MFFNDDLIVKGSDTTSLITIQGGKEFIGLMGPQVSPTPEPEPIAEEGGASDDKEKENEQTTYTIEPGTGNVEEDTSDKEASGSITVIKSKRKKQKVDNCRHKVLEFKPPITEKVWILLIQLAGKKMYKAKNLLLVDWPQKFLVSFFLDYY